VLLLICGTHGNVIRFLYPLTIPQPKFDTALQVLEDAVAECCDSSVAV
jgi:4-aminobutyrate aminotransferase